MVLLCFFERFMFPSVHRRSQINEFLYKTALFVGLGRRVQVILRRTFFPVMTDARTQNNFLIASALTDLIYRFQDLQFSRDFVRLGTVFFHLAEMKFLDIPTVRWVRAVPLHMPQ